MRVEGEVMADEDPPARERSSSYTVSDITDALQTVAQRVDGPVRYHDYMNERDDRHPSGPLIISRMRWSEACERAGVETNGPRDEFDFTREDCVAAVARAIRERGQRISSSEYEAWSEGQTTVPSLTTVKNRTDGWQTTHDEAFKRLK